jgi:phosphatidylglycerophosphate synthase
MRRLSYFVVKTGCANLDNRRRTRQSGPLGELFDHGVDACNTSLEVLLFAASQNMGQSWQTVAVLFACRSALTILLRLMILTY